MYTLSDVAAEAGVTGATVSRYLNGRIKVTAETKAKIDAALTKLNYQPHLLARRLSTGRADAISLLVPEMSTPFFGEIAASIEREARSAGYSVYMSSTGGVDNDDIEIMRRLVGSHVDGLIVMANQPKALVDFLGAHDNIVLLDEDIVGLKAPRVWVDGAHGTYLATKHLIDLGHRDIAFIGGPRERMSALDRFEGYEKALLSSDLPVKDSWVKFGSWSREFGAETAAYLFELGETPTAVVASSDYQAIGAISSIENKGLKVPDDVSVVGFDDMPFADMVNPSLTTVKQPVASMGGVAFRHLKALIDGTGEVADEVRLPVELVVRTSSGKAKQKRHMISIPTTPA